MEPLPPPPRQAINTWLLDGRTKLTLNKSNQRNQYILVICGAKPDLQV
jgi:hypothetical protein